MSILDFVAESNNLRTNRNTDQRKLDEYLTALREGNNRLQRRDGPAVAARRNPPCPPAFPRTFKNIFA